MKRVGRRAARQGGRVEQITMRDREALEMMEDILTDDFSIDELREFLEADLVDVKVDPEFKERLRRQLWDLLQDRARRPRGGSQ